MFDIDNEINKLHKIINDKEVLSFKNHNLDCFFVRFNIKIKYLLYVLRLTRYKPQVESYLIQLLKNFNIEELTFNVRGDDISILHYIIYKPTNISLNSFEIIINFGIDVNIRSRYAATPLHFMSSKSLEHYQNIINLFVKRGADLNILNFENRTVLDTITCNELNKKLKIIIVTLIDFSAKINKPFVSANMDVLEFIESYRSSNIKPAIKNEINN